MDDDLPPDAFWIRGYGTGLGQPTRYSIVKRYEDNDWMYVREDTVTGQILELKAEIATLREQLNEAQTLLDSLHWANQVKPDDD